MPQEPQIWLIFQRLCSAELNHYIDAVHFQLSMIMEGETSMDNSKTADNNKNAVFIDSHKIVKMHTIFLTVILSYVMLVCWKTK
jgi:hypothetical protein